MSRMLESEEAARRLGVKLPTLYAYVSRGLVTSHPSPRRGRSLFDVEDLDRLARRARGARRVETRLATVTTALTQLRDDGPAFRGAPATALAASATYEDVAGLLWAAPPGVWEPVDLGAVPEMGTNERLRWAVVMTGARDALRADLRPEAVVRAARTLVSTMVDTVHEQPGGRAAAPFPDEWWEARSVAGRLAARLSPAPSDTVCGAINAAMILLADHELATSTVAVRVAASTRADVYDAVLAGLATLSGPLHGGASQLAHAMVVEADRYGPEQALNETLRWQGVLPGFGHSVYKQGDPRVGVLFQWFERLATPDQRDTLATVVALAADHGIPPPNVDLGLAALAWAASMPTDAGRTIFTLARIAGWTAHYLEELEERPLRFRARAVYAAST